MLEKAQPRYFPKTEQISFVVVLRVATIDVA